jgi:hypothetical protein
MMPGFGQHVQHRGQFGQRGGGEPQSLGRQPADVDPQRHPLSITDRTAGDGVG